MITKEGERELAIYIHLPFCVRKCLYCDFISGVYPEEVREDYVNQLLRETDWVFDEICATQNDWYNQEKEERNQGEKPVITSVFLGGGTPSVLEADFIDIILCKLKEKAEFRDPEITIEVNPGTITDGAKFNRYRESGINRISIGMQSAKDSELKTLGRIHTFEDFLQTIKLAGEAGFENINVDVMYALPGQDFSSFEHSLRAAAKTGVPHISAYSLIIEENTPFYERDFSAEGIPLPDEDEERKMYSFAGKILEESGFSQYEISNYAKPGFECRHNKAYWERKEYLGLGIAAASLLKQPGEKYPTIRYTNTKDLHAYLQADSLEELKRLRTDTENLTKESAMSEFAFLGLRMNCGINGRIFKSMFGKNIEDVFADAIEKNRKAGLLTRNEYGNYCLTNQGRDVANTVMADFV